MSFDAEQKNCPECGVEWREEKNVLQSLQKLAAEGDPYWARFSEEDLVEAGADYGHTPETPRHFGTGNFLGIENPYVYDGVSVWQCQVCKTGWDRFTGKQMTPEEVEAFSNRRA